MTFPRPEPTDAAARTRLRTIGTAVAVVLLAVVVAAGVRPLLQQTPTTDTTRSLPTNASSPLPPETAPPTAPASELATAAKQGKRDKQQTKPKRKKTRQVVPSEPAEAALPPIDPVLRPFAGLSTWIDIYDTDMTSAEQVQIAADGGAQLLYVQSARHKSPTDIQDAKRLGEVLELAHDRGMLVMVWYVPDFVREKQDFRRSQAAIAFESPRGDRPDAFGLDIEIEDQPDIALRTERLLRLSSELRNWAGKDYPMAAIVLPPLQLELRQDWWPNFPYAQLRPYYDAYIPMSYSSYRGTDEATTYNWNVENVRRMRKEIGDPTVPIHLAGGIADNFPQVGAFVSAVRNSGALGGGLYDLTTTHPDAWRILRGLRAEPAG